MLKILSEQTQTSEMTFVKGEYNNKPFGMNYYYNDDSFKISGDFTKDEKVQISSQWLSM